MKKWFIYNCDTYDNKKEKKKFLEKKFEWNEMHQWHYHYVCIKSNNRKIIYKKKNK